MHTHTHTQLSEMKRQRKLRGVEMGGKGGVRETHREGGRDTQEGVNEE